MTTQIAFMTDENLKATVSKKLKEDGVTLKGFLTYCMKQYAQGKLGFELVSQGDDGFVRQKREDVLNDMKGRKDWLLSLSQKSKG